MREQRKMRNIEQLNINMKGEIGDSLHKRNICTEDEDIIVIEDEDIIVIEDEFSATEDSHDRDFYQQLVSESLPNAAQDCESSITSEYDLPNYKNSNTDDIDVKEEYIEFDDSIDREFYLQLMNDVQDSEPNSSREYDSSKSTNIESEEELDVGSIADNNSTTTYTPSPAPAGIKGRLRVRRPRRDTSTSDNSTSSSSVGKKKKKRKQPGSSVPNRRLVVQDEYVELVSDLGEDQERREHNDKERQRRGDLRLALEELRVLVPAVLGDERASKVDILKHATKYAHHLRMEFQARQKLVVELCRHQKRLRHRVDKLRNAMMR